MASPVRIKRKSFFNYDADEYHKEIFRPIEKIQIPKKTRLEHCSNENMKVAEKWNEINSCKSDTGDDIVETWSNISKICSSVRTPFTEFKSVPQSKRNELKTPMKKYFESHEPPQGNRSQCTNEQYLKEKKDENLILSDLDIWMKSLCKENTTSSDCISTSKQSEEEVQVVAEQANYKCDVCNYKSNNHRYLLKHKRIHSEKRFHCTVCNYSAHYQWQLKKHFLHIHLEQKQRHKFMK